MLNVRNISHSIRPSILGSPRHSFPERNTTPEHSYAWIAKQELKKAKYASGKIVRSSYRRRTCQIPLNTTGVVITKIDTESPINYLKVGDLIVEAQKRNIKSPIELNNSVNAALKTSSKTILIAVINDQNQKRYIGVKLK